MGQDAIPLLAVFVLTHVLVALFARFAPSVGWMDQPGGHKHHGESVPVVGGLAVVLAIGIVLLVHGELPSPARVLLGGMALLCLLGLVDDRWNLSPRWRIVLQALVAGAVCAATETWLRSMGSLWPGVSDLQTGWFALPFTVFCVVGVINAFNLVDGMDGLSSGLFLVVAGLLVAFAAPGPFQLPLAGAIAALGAFAFWNWPMRWRIRRVFLGDAGTLPLGLLLGIVLVDASQRKQGLPPACALWLFAWPLIDTVSVMWRRVAAGKSPMSADQRHVHHLLLRAGFSVRSVLLLALLVQGTLAGLAVASARAPVRGWVIAAAFLVFALAVHALVVRVETRGSFLGRRLAARVGADHV